MSDQAVQADEVSRLRIPPHSLEAEQSLIGGLLLSNAAFDRVAGVVSESDFYRREHRVIFEAISGLIRAKQTADVITVHERLLQTTREGEDIGGLPYLNDLAHSVPGAANIRRYAEIVREHSTRRQVIARCDEGASLMWARSGDLAEQLHSISSTFAQLQCQQARKLPRALADIAIERTAYYDALERGEVVAGWPTRIPALDRLLNGGLKAGNLYILAARPSVGKSSFSQAIGLNLADIGRSVLFLSQEMSSGEVADRGVSNVGRISYEALMSGKLDRDGWASVTETMDMLRQMPFFVDDQPALTLGDIRAKARDAKPQVLILDYLQLCASSRKDANRNSEIEEISRGLKALAKDLGIAVVALSQLNRDVEKRANKRPCLADLRDSGAIEQDADAVIFLWPVREFQSEGRRILGCGIDKNRQGRIGQFGLDFFGDYQRWNESTADINPDPVKPRAGGFDD